MDPEADTPTATCSCQHPAAEVVGAPVIVSASGTNAPTRAAVLTEPFDQPFPVPEYPPGEWFDRPTWVAAWREEHGLGPDYDPTSGVLKLTITDEGRVGGYFFDAGACIIHDQAACPGPSPTGYAAFHQNDVTLADGTVLLAGVIGNTHGHASPWLDWQQAQRHYADPNAQMIVCRAGDDDRGSWIAGAVVPGLTWGDVAMLRRCALSGDWRPMPESWWRMNRVPAQAVVASEGYDCIGPTLVTRPALPLVESYAASLGGKPVILGGGGGVDLPEEYRSPIAGLPDDTLVIETEVGSMARRTEIAPDGTIVIVDESANEATARARAASIAESIVASLDLPLGDPDRAWDPDGVHARLVRWASDDDGNLDEARYASAFLWREPGDDPRQYRYAIADVVDDRLVAMPAGIRAAAAAIHDHSNADRPLPGDAATAIREALDVYYARMSAALGDDAPVAPWVAAPVMEDAPPPEGEDDDVAEDGPVTREEFAAMESRVAALEEFASALIEAQMASLVAQDLPIPNLAAIEAERIIAEDAPLPTVGE